MMQTRSKGFRQGGRPKKKSPEKRGSGRAAAPKREKRLARNTDPITLTIAEIGAKGDGIARHPDEPKPYYVPLSAPGDVLVARPTTETAELIRAEIMELQEQSPIRREPPCSHFGPCGGCQLQHLNPEVYLDFKQGIVRKAMASHGFPDVEIRPILKIEPSTRRRTTVFGRVLASGPVLGFHEAGSHRIVDVGTCPLLTPALANLLPGLRDEVLPILAKDRPGETYSFVLLNHETGVDVTLVAAGTPTLEQRENLTVFAEKYDLARISWAEPDGAAEPLAERRQARITLSGVAVMPPPSAFTQVATQSEKAIIDTVLEALPVSSGRVLDLFSGIGTLSFAAATKAKHLMAVDGAQESILALKRAADALQFGDRMMVEVRNLAHRPLLISELEGFDAIIFDPPRAGAKEQAFQISQSKTPIVIGVSCNPQTFGRDARILAEGGYELDWIQPIDQFLWSHHVELVARFTHHSAV